MSTLRRTVAMAHVSACIAVMAAALPLTALADGGAWLVVWLAPSLRSRRIAVAGAILVAAITVVVAACVREALWRAADNLDSSDDIMVSVRIDLCRGVMSSATEMIESWMVAVAATAAFASSLGVWCCSHPFLCGLIMIAVSCNLIADRFLS